jgi:kinesin family protein C2/C3
MSQVVEFLDESRLKVQGSRGEKEYEFDAAFSPASTQDQVFEDTKRLVESFMDGFNVCLFAYGQTGYVSLSVCTTIGTVCVRR